MVRGYDAMHPSRRRRSSAALVLVALLVPWSAHADPQLWVITANEDPARYFQNNVLLDCLDPVATQRFYVYARSGIRITGITAAQLDGVIASSLPYVFCGHERPPALPPFWRVGAGECNEGGLLPTSEPPANTWGYASLWRTQRPSLYWTAGSADTLREGYGVTLVPATPVDMEAERIYYVGQLVLSKCAGAVCAGCDGSVEVPLRLTVHDATQDRYIADAYVSVNIFGICGTYPPPDPSQFRAVASLPPKQVAVTAASVCDEVPVRHTAWGDLKLRYR